MNVWVVSREYAGIAEAGGVKNVACSLSESLAAAGHAVTLFIPLYGCTDLGATKDFTCVWHTPVSFRVQERPLIVTFSHAVAKGGVQVVFVGNRHFSEKHGVYTYTNDEEKSVPAHRHGSGHEDAAFLNTLFQKAVVAYGDTCEPAERPDIIHSQDATAALVPVFLQHKCGLSPRSAAFYRDTHCVVTIHNAGPGYHHEFRSLPEAAHFTGLPEELLRHGLNGAAVEPFLLAAACGACITTVSPEYAEEITSGTTDTAGLSQAFARMGVPITGITNGIDTDRYDPATPEASRLPYAFSPEKRDLGGKARCREDFIARYACREAPQQAGTVIRHGFLQGGEGADTVYVAYHGRVVNQKGISVLAAAASRLLSEGLPVRFIFIGQGQPDLEQELIALCGANEGRCAYFHGYDQTLARLGIAAADFAVFPSFFEPCGLADLIAQIYGTLPVAHATGGLKKIVNEETGFLYAPNTPETLAGILRSLVLIKSRTDGDIFNTMISYAASYVRAHFSWQSVAEHYERLYTSLKGQDSAKRNIQ